MRTASVFFAAAISACALLASPAEARGSCAGGYAYAGVRTEQRVAGISAVITPIATTGVVNGHVAAWVGIGGPRAWLQVGLNAFPGTAGANLYYELKTPGSAPRYRELATALPLGSSSRVAIRGVARRPGWWRVWVDRRPVTEPLHLSLRAEELHATVTAESHNAGPACNALRFRFDAVSVTGQRDGSKWRPIVHPMPFADHGYRFVRAPHGAFLALSL